MQGWGCVNLRLRDFSQSRFLINFQIVKVKVRVTPFQINQPHQHSCQWLQVSRILMALFQSSPWRRSPSCQFECRRKSMPSRSTSALGGWRGACCLPAEVQDRRQAAASPMVHHPWLGHGWQQIFHYSQVQLWIWEVATPKNRYVLYFRPCGLEFTRLNTNNDSVTTSESKGRLTFFQWQIKRKTAALKVPPLITSGGRLSDTDWNRKWQHRCSRRDKRP